MPGWKVEMSVGPQDWIGRGREMEVREVHYVRRMRMGLSLELPRFYGSMLYESFCNLGSKNNPVVSDISHDKGQRMLLD